MENIRRTIFGEDTAVSSAGEVEASVWNGEQKLVEIAHSVASACSKKIPSHITKLCSNMALHAALITPEMAQEIVSTHTNFRDKRDNAIANYVNLMARDLWIPGPPLIFGPRNGNKLGNLLDGQNRLWAVIGSKKPQWFIVLEGIPEPSTIAFDNGAKRTKSEVLKYLFTKHAWIEEMFDGVSPGAISSILVALNGGLNTSYMANSELLEAVEKYKAALQFAVDEFFPKDQFTNRRASRLKGITRAHTVGAFCRALIKYPNLQKKIVEAARKLVKGGFDGYTKPNEKGFNELRVWLLKSSSLTGSGANHIIYERVATCLYQYIHEQETEFKEPKMSKPDEKGQRSLTINRDFRDPFFIAISDADMSPPPSVAAVVKKPKGGKRGRPRKNA